MKKSQLKTLLRIITEEVIAAKQKQLNETKGLSGMKAAKESKEHTETISDSKDLTGSSPEEKTEGKKLPVVKKPANPQVGIKEEILTMIREAIEEAVVDEERGRKPLTYDEKTNTISGIGSKFMVKDPSSPTGYATTKPYTIKSTGKVLPAGTPAQPNKRDLGQSTSTSAGSNTTSSVPANLTGSGQGKATKEAVENILTTIWNNNNKSWPEDVDKMTSDITAEIRAKVQADKEANMKPTLSDDPAIIASAVVIAKDKIEQDSDDAAPVGGSDEFVTIDSPKAASTADVIAQKEKEKEDAMIRRAASMPPPKSPKLAGVRDAFKQYLQRKGINPK